MIYIYKNNDNDITTDNIVNFIPDNLTIYLDDILIGTYENTSIYKTFLTFVIPNTDLELLQEREYKMKIINHFETIKEEIIIIKEVSSFEVKSLNKTNNIKMYES